VAHHNLDSLSVDALSACYVVCLGDVGELISETLSVKILFSVGSLVLHNLVRDDHIFVASLLARSEVCA
jgi:hypothetical protein